MRSAYVEALQLALPDHLLNNYQLASGSSRVLPLAGVVRYLQYWTSRNQTARYAIPNIRGANSGQLCKAAWTGASTASLIGFDRRRRACSQASPSLSVKPSKHPYAAIDRAVRTTTTLPLVLNFFLFNPSSPISEKNCLFPCCLRSRLISRMPAP